MEFGEEDRGAEEQKSREEEEEEEEEVWSAVCPHINEDSRALHVM